MKIHNIRRAAAVVLAAVLIAGTLPGCSPSSSNSGDQKKKESVTIYTSIEDYRIEYLNKRLEEEFPQYDITVVFYATGDHYAKLLKEGTDTDCDITLSLEYSLLQDLDSKGDLADVSSYNKGTYESDLIISDDFLPQERGSGAIIINTELLSELGLDEPKSYEDLLKPEYRGLVSMPNPKESSTGYMFYKSLVNAWGEKKTLAYFDKLTDNILQYTESGSGPLKAVAAGKAAIGLGTTATAVAKINEGTPLKIEYFKEGAPYSVYGQAIIKGKEQRQAVKDVFDFLVNTFSYENCEKYMPEKLYKDKTFTLKNYPEDIKYADMSNNTIEEKERLNALWKY
jgi:ABC-type Fe3+ transport system, periplasmic component